MVILLYSVYLVDDEALMLDSIQSAVDWFENGFQIVGFQTDPFRALEEIPVLKPELLLCDLKMPGMDGIALMQELREKGMDGEFVMLSAYGEFDASRSFFLLNGFDYLLKPLEAQEAEIMLERLSRKLAAKNSLRHSTTFVPTQNPAFDALILYVSEHFAKKHTLKALSEMFHIAPTYICNLFVKHYGSTLTSFLTDLRMKEAAQRMRSTGASLKEIAVSCGYTDYFYFSRIFKAHFGVTPTEYRIGHRGDAE